MEAKKFRGYNNETKKFRGYNNETKKFLTDKELSYYTIDDLLYSDPIIFSQLIDTLDKNKQEIYEGDVLTIWCGKYKQTKPMVIENMHSLYFELNRDDSYYRVTKVKVIGNIYDNPELLK